VDSYRHKLVAALEMQSLVFLREFRALIKVSCSPNLNLCKRRVPGFSVPLSRRGKMGRGPRKNLGKTRKLLTSLNLQSLKQREKSRTQANHGLKNKKYLLKRRKKSTTD